MNELIDDLEKFRSGLDTKHQGFEAVDPPNANYRIATELCSLFGFRLYCCRHLPYIGVTDFQNIFIRVPEHGTQHPLWVAGHEIWHLLQRHFGEVVYPFQASAIASLTPDAIERRRFIEDDGARRALHALMGNPVEEPESSEETVIDEVFADVYANMWCDRIFWIEIRDRARLHSSCAIEGVLEFLCSEKLTSYRQWHGSPATVSDQLVTVTVDWLTAGIVRADMRSTE